MRVEAKVRRMTKIRRSDILSDGTINDTGRNVQLASRTHAPNPTTQDQRRLSGVRSQSKGRRGQFPAVPKPSGWTKILLNTRSLGFDTPRRLGYSTSAHWHPSAFIRGFLLPARRRAAACPGPAQSRCEAGRRSSPSVPGCPAAPARRGGYSRHSAASPSRSQRRCR